MLFRSAVALVLTAHEVAAVLVTEAATLHVVERVAVTEVSVSAARGRRTTATAGVVRPMRDTDYSA